MKLDAEFQQRAKAALEAMMGTPSLMVAVKVEVDAFYTRYPALIRTPEAEGFVASLVIEKLSSAADSQSAAGSSEEPRKQVA